MKKIISCMALLCSTFIIRAQELYVSTEPASNMATGSIGIRLNSKLFRMKYNNSYSLRLDPEIMFGVNKKLMIHLNAYSSNMYQSSLKFEGGSFYAKYRFVSVDDVHSHFRMAAFGKISAIDNPFFLYANNKYYYSDEIDLDGNNSGFLSGIVATQLLHKLALSSSVAFAHSFRNISEERENGQSTSAVNYSLSAGYLLFPVEYKNFNQTNVNLYCEVLGSSSVDGKGYYVDAAPAIQFIFKSIARLDLSYRAQFAGTMTRLSDNYFLLRLEYNLLNVFKNK